TSHARPVRAGRVPARPPRALRRRLVLTATFLAGWGGVAVGVAGALALAVKVIWGPGAIATAFPAGSYSSADCARWLAGYPQYGTCQQAMVADHADDVIRNAAIALVLGLLALGVRAMLRRAWHDGSRPVLESAIGAALALLVALGSAGIAFDSVTVTHGHGAGQPIAFAVAAALACVGLGRAAMRAAARPLLARRPA
ncbi:MAG TPA: hypothetical protein VHO01_03560, partial [Jatrophihabitans sp.]|nr:hypothetical protein [Jatrophihabitans sp.]